MLFLSLLFLSLSLVAEDMKSWPQYFDCLENVYRSSFLQKFKTQGQRMDMIVDFKKHIYIQPHGLNRALGQHKGMKVFFRDKGSYVCSFEKAKVDHRLPVVLFSPDFYIQLSYRKDAGGFHVNEFSEKYRKKIISYPFYTCKKSTKNLDMIDKVRLLLQSAAKELGGDLFFLKKRPLFQKDSERKEMKKVIQVCQTLPKPSLERRVLWRQWQRIQNALKRIVHFYPFLREKAFSEEESGSLEVEK